MRCHRVVSAIALACAAALAAAAGGCSKNLIDSNTSISLPKPSEVFAKPDWAKATIDSKTVELGPKGPVGVEELVGVDGRCAPPVSEAPPQPAAQAAPEPPADRPVGSVAGDLAGPPMPAGLPAPAAPAIPVQPSTPQVVGGVALGMTECDAARRAGLASNVAISDEKGERKAVLTYLTGPWPGIYTFYSGRLKVIDRAPIPVAAPKAPPKKKARTAAQPKAAAQ